MTTDAVRTFLFDTYGYAQIERLVRGEKHPMMSLKRFLEGTVLGTWLDYDPLERKRTRAPFINGTEPREDVRDGGFDPRRRGDLRYRIKEGSCFTGFSREDIGRFVETKILTLFPDAKHTFEKTGDQPNRLWYRTIDDSEIGFYLRGSGSSQLQKKFLVVDFNASPETVQSIDDIVRGYQGQRRRFIHEEAARAVEAKAEYGEPNLGKCRVCPTKGRQKAVIMFGTLGVCGEDYVRLVESEILERDLHEQVTDKGIITLPESVLTALQKIQPEIYSRYAPYLPNAPMEEGDEPSLQ